MKRILLLSILLGIGAAQGSLRAQAQPAATERASWNVTLKSGTQATSNLEIENHCKQPHTFNVAKQPDMDYFQYALESPLRISGHQSVKLPVQFTTVGVPEGQYHGNVQVLCLDCRTEPTCLQDRENLPVNLTVAPPNPENESGGRVNVRAGEVTTEPQTQTPGKEIQTPKENEPEEYFIPSGMERLVRANAQKWWFSPFPPPGVNWWWNCCCCCENVAAAPQPAPTPAPGGAKPSAPSSPPISVSVKLDVGKFGQGKAIHILYVAAPAQYLAETYVQWTASGGTGQLTVDLDVQRPGSSTWTKLVSGMGPDDEHLYSTSTPGTYVFRATARDSTGKTSFNTLTVTFPRI